MMFTPEESGEQKWTESFIYAFKETRFTIEEFEADMVKAKEIDKDYEFTTTALGPKGYVYRAWLPMFHSHVVTRVITRSHGAFFLSYEDRRQQGVGMKLEDWDSILSAPEIEKLDGVTQVNEVH